MPYITAPKSTKAPDVAALAGVPIETGAAALSGPMQGLMDAARPYVEPIMDEARGVAGDIFSPVSKAIQALRGANAEAGSGEPLTHFGEAWQAAKTSREGVPFGSPTYGPNVTAMPKPGGTLDQVLQRGAEAQGAGQDVSPGTARLLQHYTSLIR